jgi:hypothetical protein
MLREVNSAVSVWNTEREQRKANESAAMQIEDESSLNPTQMSNILEKMLNEKLSKEKKKLRKNFLADLKKSQRLATSAGPKQHGASSNSRKGSEKQQQKQSQKQSQGNRTQQSKKKKKKKVRFEEDEVDQPSPNLNGNRRERRAAAAGRGGDSRAGRGRGGRGGSSNGG